MSRVLSQIWQTNAKGQEKILFLDEPASHLDIKYQHQLLQAAKGLCKKNVIVVAVLHNINLVLHYADRILFMKQGSIVYEILQEDQVTPSIIKDVFDIDAAIVSLNDKYSLVVVFRYQN